MRKYLAGFIVALVLIGAWNAQQWATKVRAQAAHAEYQRAQLWKLAAALASTDAPPTVFSDAEIARIKERVARGDQAFAFLASVLAKDKDGKVALTMGDALVQIVQAQLKAAQAQQAPVAK